MLLARGDEEITNKASHQVLQEGKYHIYLQLKKIKQRHRSRKNISASFLNDLSSLSRCFGFLQSSLETHGRTKRPKVWETEGAKASQQGSTTRRLERRVLRLVSPSSARHLLASQWQWQHCPGVEGQDCWVHSSISSRNAAWKGMKEEGLGKAREVKRIHAWMRKLELAFPK